MTEFRIADTFTDSLARLTGDEQKLVKTTAFDLQVNPANPGMSFHKIDKSKDKNFWSVRVGTDIRLIVHKVKDSLLLCFVDHHDKASTGPSGESLRLTRRRVPRSWSNCARRCKRSLSPSTCRLNLNWRHNQPPERGCYSLTDRTTNCLAMVCLSNGSTT